MSFLGRVKEVTADVLGYMSKDELKQKLPDVYRAYEEAYGSKKPDIKIVTNNIFSFPNEKYTMGSWHIIYAVLNGKTKPINVAQYYGKSEKLVPNSMFLDCIKGNLNICYLYVHPDDAAPLIKGGDELSDTESLVLALMKGYKSFAREDEFYNSKYGSKVKNNSNEYKDTLVSLADKGLVKINKAGSAMLTLEGKNRSIQATKVAKEKFKLY